MTVVAMPTEAEAIAEMADIDALLKEADDTVRKLRDRRAQLDPVSKGTARRLAVAVHAVFCEQQHYRDYCEFRTKAWTDWGGSRAQWLGKAKSRLEASGKEPAAYVEALLAVASPEQLVLIEEETEKVAEVEYNAMFPPAKIEETA